MLIQPNLTYPDVIQPNLFREFEKNLKPCYFALLCFCNLLMLFLKLLNLSCSFIQANLYFYNPVENSKFKA